MGCSQLSHVGRTHTAVSKPASSPNPGPRPSLCPPHKQACLPRITIRSFLPSPLVTITRNNPTVMSPKLLLPPGASGSAPSEMEGKNTKRTPDMVLSGRGVAGGDPSAPEGLGVAEAGGVRHELRQLSGETRPCFIGVEMCVCRRKEEERRPHLGMWEQKAAVFPVGEKG